MADPDLTEAEKRIQISAAKGDWATFGRNLADNISEETSAAAAQAPKMADAKEAERLTSLEHWFNSRMEQVRHDPGALRPDHGNLGPPRRHPGPAGLGPDADLLFVFNRRYYVFDHVIFSMHSLSFQLLLLIGDPGADAS
jgi:hypothetical protein